MTDDESNEINDLLQQAYDDGFNDGKKYIKHKIFDFFMHEGSETEEEHCKECQSDQETDQKKSENN